jgi:4'-phosphopantetheinyl transferase
VHEEDLPEAECHLWVVRAPECLSCASREAYESLLTGEERARYLAFRFERHRHLFLVTRALVRTTLSRYASVAPADWRFGAGTHGKPYVCAPELPLSLNFNLSNTAGMVVCAIARDVPLGVDVEDTNRLEDPTAIADRFFSRREVRELRAAPAARQRDRFFAYWTFKEAYVKARGLGLSLPLDQFSVVLGDGHRVELAFDPRLGDDGRAWQCARVEVEAPYALAVVMRRNHARDHRLRVRRMDAATLLATPREFGDPR